MSAANWAEEVSMSHSTVLVWSGPMAVTWVLWVLRS